MTKPARPVTLHLESLYLPVAASFGSGMPIALETKGAVREARGFTSST